MRLERTLAFWTKKLSLAYLNSWLSSTTNLMRESKKIMSSPRIKLRQRMKMSNLTKMILKLSKKKTTTSMISSIQLLRSLVSFSRLMVHYAENWLINLLMVSCLPYLTLVRNRKLNSVSLSWMIWSNSSDLIFWDLFTSRLLNRSLNSAVHLLLLWGRLHLMVLV